MAWSPVRAMARALLPLTLLAAGCPKGTGPTGVSATHAASPAPGTSPVHDAGATASPLVAASGSPGSVLPPGAAVDALVRAFLISDVGSAVVSSGGARIVGIVRVPLIGNNGASALGATRTFGLLDLAASDAFQAPAPLTSVRTEADGHFTLAVPAGAHVNLEAVQSDTVKSFAADVTPGADVTLDLAPTGTIAGRVTTTDPAVTHLLGVDVYVPGTSYVAKTDDTGHFQLDHVPVGTFMLVASKPGLGEATAAGVAVASTTTTTAPDMVLALARPHLAGLEPNHAGVGATVTLRGDHFGASSGGLLDVAFGGTPATDVHRVDDATLSALVPTGATTADVTVLVDGVRSNALPFDVITGFFSVTPTEMLVGGHQPVAVTYGPANKAVAAGELKLEGSAFALAADGTLTAKAPGQATLSCRSGTASGTWTFTAHPVMYGVEDLGGGVSASQIVLDGHGMVWLSQSPGGGATVSRVVDNAVVPVTSPDLHWATALGVGPDGRAVAYDTTTGFCALASNGTTSRLATWSLPDVPQLLTTDRQGNFLVVTFASTGMDLTQTPPKSITVAKLYRMTTAGAATLLAGGLPTSTDGVGAAAGLGYPAGLAALPDGTIYFRDGVTLRRVASDGTVTTVLGDRTVSASAPVDGEGAAVRFTTSGSLLAGPGSVLYAGDGRWIRAIDVADPAHPRVTTALGGGQFGLTPPGQDGMVAPEAVVLQDTARLAVDPAGPTFYVIGFSAGLQRLVRHAAP